MIPEELSVSIERASGGRFSVVGTLGHGANGVVVRVHDRQLGQDLALKTLGRLEPASLALLKEEFRALAGILHPNLALLHELFVLEGGGFFTMELVEGRPFVEALAGESSERWEVATAELVSALDHLHRSGKLHCDVKPSNVLVDRGGRVVVLDFGMTTPLSTTDAERPREIRCSPAYAAPEQLWGGTLTPAADWYGVGVMLFELMAGRLPFVGDVGEISIAKQNFSPPKLRSVAPDAPAALADLVDGLLEADPDARVDPGRWLIEASSEFGGGLVGSGPGRARSFVGRVDELARLASALRTVREDGRAVVAAISGRPGIGKSGLVRHFLAGTRRETGALVLEGRCHPRETVPFQVLDQVVDALARELVALTPDELEAIRPAAGPELAILFPVLARLPWQSEAPPPPVGVDPLVLRRRGAEALRVLLRDVARRTPLVVWIDDFQWSDPDGLTILRQVMREPDPPALLFIASFRSEETPVREWLSDFARPEEGRGSPAERVWIDLAELAMSEVVELADEICRELGDGAGDGARDDEALLALAEGSPFAIEQILRVAARRERRGEVFRLPATGVEGLLAARVEGLSADERALLDVVALAGHPVAAGPVLEASRIRGPALRALGRLESERLIRWIPGVARPHVDVDHDRIREGLLAGMAPDAAADGHRRLVLALEGSPDADPQDLFLHALRGGDRARALAFGHRAADRARELLAFGRAAAVYREMIPLVATGGDEEVTLQRRFGEALELDGQSLEAARIFDRLSRSASASGSGGGGEVGATEVRGLERRAAELYLRTGHFAEGMEITRRVLGENGVGFPGSHTRALAQLAWRRLRLWRRGLAFTPRPTSAVDAVRHRRLEAVWGTAISFSISDQVIADSLGALHLHEALDHGDVVHVGRALGWEATKAVQVGSPRTLAYGRRALDALNALAAAQGDSHLLAWSHACSGIWNYQRGEWRAALVSCDESVRMLREVCPEAPGAVFTRITFDAFSLSALAHMGELAELARRLPAAIADVDERGDLYAGIGLRAGILNLVWLAEDRSVAARQVIDESIRRWPIVEGFQIQHYLELIGRVNLELYEGRPEAALAAVEKAWPHAKKAGFLFLESPSVELRNLRGRALVGTAAAVAHAGRNSVDLGADLGRFSLARLLAEAEREAKALDRCGVASAAPFAELLRAGVASVAGRASEAAARAERAAASFDRVEMGLYRAGALSLEAHADPPRRTALLESMAASLREQGVTSPVRMARVFAPASIASRELAE